jgi:hypothetical protein
MKGDETGGAMGRGAAKPPASEANVHFLKGIIQKTVMGRAFQPPNTGSSNSIVVRLLLPYYV